jgi:hypothetical protein
MPLLSLTPLSAKVIKDCFKTTIEYTFTSVSAAGQQPAQEVKKKVQILHQVQQIEALLIWRATFNELCLEKLWNPRSKFMNARLLLAGSCKAKWAVCVEEHLGEGNLTNANFNETMQAFMEMYCSNHDTQRVRDMITSAKKPSGMSIRDFVSRLEELNGYLPFLPPPLNTEIDEDELLVVICRPVPTWNNPLDRTAVQMENIQEITNYYQSLEEVEARTNQRNSNNQNQSNNRNGNRERGSVSRNNNNNNDYNNQSGNSSGRNNDRNNQYNNNNYRNNNDNRPNNYNNNNNYRSNNNNNNNDNRNNRSNSNNNNYNNRNRNFNNNNNQNNNYRNNSNYNQRPRNEMNHMEEEEEDNRSQMSYQSAASRNSH